MHPPTNRTSRSWLPGFLAGLSLGLAMWQWRQRKDRAEISRQRLEREAESERLRLRLTSIQEPEPVIDLTDAPSGGSAAAAPSSPSPALTETAAPVLSVVVDPAAVATPSGNGNGVGRHDDLKRIKGIGPVMERSLNEQGIHSFEQLARLTKPEIDRLTAAIAAFPGRIEREDWVGSARRLLDAEQPASDSPLF
ncbi:MAG: hypothetical protein R2761_18165 [Acidimicrobiales bacterium]